MPAGKLGATAGSVWSRGLDGDVIMRSSLCYGVSMRSLRPYWSKRKAKEQPDIASTKEWRRRLREAFRRYLRDCGRYHPTATELRKSLNEIATAAARFAASGKRNSADKLLKHLESDRNAETIVRRAIWSHDLDWPGFKTELRNLYATGGLAENSFDVASRIAGIDVVSLVPESGSWRDPALFRLVSVLAPLWEEITGRTAAQSTADRIEDLKEFRFATWLAEMHAVIGVPNPPAGGVLDIVLRQKKENPASVQ
jgi:hypothetical protein